jgi:hypothetical protein
MQGRNVSETVAIHGLPHAYGARNDNEYLRARSDENAFLSRPPVEDSLFL